jgi:hypothetical protein
MSDEVKNPEAKAFRDWWDKDGRFYDPDTSDVPWFDKREFLAEYAFDAARAGMGNFTVDDEAHPTRATFACGRTVHVVMDGGRPRLVISPLEPAPV